LWNCISRRAGIPFRAGDSGWEVYRLGTSQHMNSNLDLCHFDFLGFTSVLSGKEKLLKPCFRLAWTLNETAFRRRELMVAAGEVYFHNNPL